MKDILGQEIKVGDIVAHAQRHSNKAYFSLKLVTDLRTKRKEAWTTVPQKVKEVKVIGYTTSRWVWDGEAETGKNINGFFMNDRGGWTTPDVLVVVTDKAPKDVKAFLQNKI